MEKVNLCETCGREATSFGLKGSRKTRSCREHVALLLDKKMQVTDIEGYEFVSNPQDFSAYEERKVQVEKGRGNLTVLEANCSRELSTALKAIEDSKRKVMKSVEHRCNEMKAVVTAACSDAKEQLSQLEGDFKTFLTCKDNLLAPTALLLCSEMSVVPEFLGFDIADASDSVSAVLSESWTVATPDVKSTLKCLDAGQVKEAIAHAFAGAAVQAQKGIPRALQYVNLLTGDESCYDEEKDKVLAELFKLEKARVELNLKWLDHSWSLRQRCVLADESVIEVGRQLAILLYSQLAQFSEAEEVLRHCFEVARQSQRTELSMSLCNEICGVYLAGAQYLQLDRMATWVLGVFGTASLPAAHFWTTVLYLAYSKEKQSRDSEASALLDDWLKRNLTEEDPLAEALQLVTCALGANLSGRRREAIEMLLRAKDIGLCNFPASPFTAFALFRLATLSEGRSREKYHRQAESIYEVAAPKSAQAANNIFTLGNFYFDTKQETEAKECYQKAKSIFAEAAPASIDAAMNFSKLGIILQKSKEARGEAEECYRKAQVIFDGQNPSSTLAAVNLGNLGIFLKEEERYDEAEKCYLQVHSIYEVEAPESIEAAKNLFNLGLLRKQMKRLAEAKDSFLQARRVYEKAGPETTHAANNLSALGDLLWQAGESDEAENCYRFALSVYGSKAAGSVEAANTHFQLGLLLEAKGQFEQALVCMRKSASAFSENHDTASKDKVEERIASLQSQCVIS